VEKKEIIDILSSVNPALKKELLNNLVGERFAMTDQLEKNIAAPA
jgi:hypothetical protein